MILDFEFLPNQILGKLYRQIQLHSTLNYFMGLFKNKLFNFIIWLRAINLFKNEVQYNSIFNLFGLFSNYSILKCLNLIWRYI